MNFNVSGLAFGFARITSRHICAAHGFESHVSLTIHQASCFPHSPISRFTSLSRKPDARTRPGNLCFAKIPLEANLSTVRSEHEKRRATSARRTRRGSAEISGLAFCTLDSRIAASNRARSCGVSVGSPFNPERTISSVVFSIKPFRQSSSRMLA